MGKTWNTYERSRFSHFKVAKLWGSDSTNYALSSQWNHWRVAFLLSEPVTPARLKLFRVLLTPRGCVMLLRLLLRAHLLVACDDRARRGPISALKPETGRGNIQPNPGDPEGWNRRCNLFDILLSWSLWVT